MKSNWTLLPAGLLVAVLALAGCGGGSSDDTTAPPPPPPTPEQECEGAGNNWHEGACYTDQELIDLGVEQGKKDAADEAEEARKAAEAEAAAVAMAATAAKLYAGISAPSGEFAADGTIVFATTDRAAGYNEAGTRILLSIGEGDTAHTAVSATLSEDKKAMVDALSGWAGKRYADPTGGDIYEAVVYSNVEAPKQGKKFGGAAANDEFQYALTSGVTDAAAAVQNGEIAVSTATTEVQERIGLTSVTRTAGTETFKFSASEVTDRRIDVPGSYHGVSGTYYCTPSTRADGCTASVAAKGFTLGAGDWAFKPADPNARVMSAADTVYASYGWWLKKTENDATYTASAFVDDKGTVDANTIAITALNGTATYQGGAAGKYALHSATGGTNDAGHFTADAMLEANFNDETVTGTIDNFMGTDGMARDWSVELKEASIADNGSISRTADDDTVWTIDETAAAAAGEWSGNLKKIATDGGVPTVATGTFYSEYGTAGRMVGAFGANQQ